MNTEAFSLGWVHSDPGRSGALKAAVAILSAESWARVEQDSLCRV